MPKRGSAACGARTAHACNTADTVTVVTPSMRFFGFGFLGGMPPSALSREMCAPAPLRETASEADRELV